MANMQDTFEMITDASRQFWLPSRRDLFAKQVLNPPTTQLVLGGCVWRKMSNAIHLYFWYGYDGLPDTPAKRTAEHAAYQAGKFRRDLEQKGLLPTLSFGSKQEIYHGNLGRTH